MWASSEPFTPAIATKMKLTCLFQGIATSMIFALPASAQTIVGGSDLLTVADVAQLGAWLGEGATLRLTNVFDKAPGSGLTSTDFHNAADGLGRTFVVYKDVASGQRFGGYNPQSWSVIQGYNSGLTPPAWLFNLDTGERQDQFLTYQTYNYILYGPTFGGGHDIWVGTDLTSGYVRTHSYGGGTGTPDILGGVGTHAIQVDDIEVFTIALETIGTNYCTANPNSTGQTGSILAGGSDVVADGDLSLTAVGLPVGEFALFLNSPAQGFVANPGGSAGNLCLSGQIGRHTAQIGLTLDPGYFSIQVDLNSLPRPKMGPVAVQPGETWNFQGWYRDGATSNFTDGVSILFQ
jgi:TLD